MPVEYFIVYKGQRYDVGTKLRFYQFGNNYLPAVIGVIEEFVHNWVFIRGDDGQLYKFSTVCQDKFNTLILEIIEPIYYNEPTEQCTETYRVRPPIGDIDVGWVWYIVIMLVGVIFKEAFIIWIFATVVFFLWKNGYLNGGKK